MLCALYWDFISPLHRFPTERFCVLSKVTKPSVKWSCDAEANNARASIEVHDGLRSCTMAVASSTFLLFWYTWSTVEVDDGWCISFVVVMVSSVGDKDDDISLVILDWFLGNSVCWFIWQTRHLFVDEHSFTVWCWAKQFKHSMNAVQLKALWLTCWLHELLWCCLLAKNGSCFGNGNWCLSDADDDDCICSFCATFVDVFIASITPSNS